MLAGPVLVTMATRLRWSQGGGKDLHATVPPFFWIGQKRGGRGVRRRVGDDVTCSPVPRWEGSSPGAPAGSKHRHNGHVFKVGLRQAAGTQAGSITAGFLARRLVACAASAAAAKDTLQRCGAATPQHCTSGPQQLAGKRAATGGSLTAGVSCDESFT